MKLQPSLLVLITCLMGVDAHATTIEMKVNGLVCAFCAQGIEKQLRKFPATAEVVVSLEQRFVAVSLRDGQGIPDTELRNALTNAGYTVKSIERTQTPMAEVRARLKQGKR